MAYQLYVSVVIISSSVANPTVITTETPHGFATGEGVAITGHTGSTPSINASYYVTRIDDTHFSIPVNVTVAGAGGRVFGVRRAKVESFRLTETINERGTLEVDILDPYGKFRPGLDGEVWLYEEASQLLWAGTVTRPSEEGYGPPPSIVTKITAADFSIFAERVLVTGVILNGTLKYQLQQLITRIASAPYSITLDPTQPDGPTLDPVEYFFTPLKDILRDLSVRSGGYLERWNADRTFGMFLPSFSAVTAPFQIIENNYIGDVKVESFDDDYANRVWLKCGAEAGKETERFFSGTTPIGQVVGNTTVYTMPSLGIQFSSIPEEIMVGGAPFPIGAPGTKNGDDPWEWLWKWNGYTYPELIHDDTFGTTPNGTFLSITSPGFAYWNTREVMTLGGLYQPPSGSPHAYRWYFMPAELRKFEDNLHTVYINRTLLEVGGARQSMGAFGTINEITDLPWQWVYHLESNMIGHLSTETALVNTDIIRVYARMPFELVLQFPLASSEPTSEQSARGLRERLFEAPYVTDPAIGLTTAEQIYNRVILRPKKVTYPTLSASGASRLKPGQVQTIQVAARNLNSQYLINSVETSMYGGAHVQQAVTASDAIHALVSWQEEYRRDSRPSGSSAGSASVTVVGGGGGGGTVVSGQRPVYPLASGTEAQQSATPTWVAASNMQAIIDTVARGTTAGIVVVRLRLLSASSVSVQARLRNVTDSVTVGTSTSVTSTSWTMVPFAVSLTPGSKTYQLELLPGAANQDVQASGYLE